MPLRSALHPMEEESLRNAVSSIVEWLSPHGFDINVRIEDDADDPSRMGVYEMGTVFGKTIEVTVSPQAIRDYIKYYATAWEMEDDLQRAGWTSRQGLRKRYSAFQFAMTVYHELGHALLEQIIDWMENIPEFDEIFGEDFIMRYDAVLEDSLPEEDLVEDFAWSCVQGRVHVLKSCFIEMSERLSKV